MFATGSNLYLYVYSKLKKRYTELKSPPIQRKCKLHEASLDLTAPFGSKLVVPMGPREGKLLKKVTVSGYTTSMRRILNFNLTMSYYPVLEEYFGTTIGQLRLTQAQFDHICLDHFDNSRFKSYFFVRPTKDDLLNLAAHACLYGEVVYEKSNDNSWLIFLKIFSADFSCRFQWIQFFFFKNGFLSGFYFFIFQLHHTGDGVGFGCNCEVRPIEPDADH